MNDIGSSLSVYYQNVRGLRTKTATFFENVLTSDSGLIVLTETWLHSDIYSAELFNDVFLVYRCDRSSVDKIRGGGVLIAVCKRFLSFDLNPGYTNNSFEIKCVKVLACAKSIVIISVYIPPSSDVRTYEECFSYIESFALYSDQITILVGDFNIPQFCNNNCNSNVVQLTFEFMSYMQLIQYNTIRNVSDVVLDLVLSSIECTVTKSINPLVSEDVHHPALQIKYAMSTAAGDCVLNRVEQYNFAKGDYLLLYNLMKNVDWSILSSFKNDINSYTAHFYRIIWNIIDQSVPKTIYSNRYPKWYNKEIISALKNKLHYKNLFKKYGKLKYKIKFDSIRDTVATLVKSSYAQYICECEKNIKSNPKLFWSFINSKKGNSSVPNMMFLDNQPLRNGQSISDAFARYFESVYSNTDVVTTEFDDFYQNKYFVNQTLNITSFNESDILGVARKIRSNSKGPDNIPGFIFRGCISELVKPLLVIFNLSLQSGIFPAIWKRSRVCPVFKSGDRGLINNYRAISILCFPAKIFESLLYDCILKHVEGALSVKQHGFLPKRSTVTNLCCMTQYISDCISNRSQVDSIYTDLTKAFDRLNQHKLSRKLQMYGLSDGLVNLLSSYLLNRELYVSVNNFQSKPFFSTSGVPQGSNLGPLLFLIYFNDIIASVQNSEILLYADDLKIYRRVDSLYDCTLLQKDLDLLSDWCRINDLNFNISKCAVLSFSNARSPMVFDYRIVTNDLNRVTEICDLGVTFDCKLSFSVHIFNVINRASKLLGFVVRNSKMFDTTDVLDFLYMTLVRSKLEYACVIWNPIYEKYVYSLESVQSRYLKCKHFRITGDYIWHQREFLQNVYKTISLQNRRWISTTMHLYGLLNNEIDNIEFLKLISIRVPRSVNIRNKELFYTVYARTTVAVQSPLYSMCNVYNSFSLEIDIFSLSKSVFRTLLEKAMQPTHLSFSL